MMVLYRRVEETQNNIVFHKDFFLTFRFFHFTFYIFMSCYNNITRIYVSGLRRWLHT